MEYIGQIIVFLSALVAIKGETWNKDEKGINRITITGYLTIFFALLGLVISLFNSYHSDIENTANRKTIEGTKLNTEDAKLALMKANLQIDSLNHRLVVVNANLEIYQEIIGQIKEQSDRQDQTVMMEAVQLEPGGSWISPSPIFTGSRIEFLGFGSGLVMEYGSRREQIPAWDGHAIETAIIGESGKGFNIRLYNSGNRSIGGKIHVTSSPRVRSKDWSWIEEKLKQ